MSDSPDIPSFGLVDLDGEHGILSIESGAGASCRLTRVSRTERGYPRHEIAVISLATWRQVAAAVQKELSRGMGPDEIEGRAPTFSSGEQALSPLVTRELSVLFWSLMEDGEGTHIDALLAGWRQLAREERWWLYARASNPTQRQGRGWRKALFFALTDPADTRTAPRLLEIMEAASAQKKNLDTKQSVSYLEPDPKKKRPKKKAIPELPSSNPPRKKSPQDPSSEKSSNPLEKKAKKPPSKRSSRK